MLHLGVEIDLDRIQNMHINVNVFKLLMEDIHKRSNIATPFRVRLLSLISVANPLEPSVLRGVLRF
jgi:hypothetical protein